MSVSTVSTAKATSDLSLKTESDPFGYLTSRVYVHSKQCHHNIMASVPSGVAKIGFSEKELQ